MAVVAMVAVLTIDTVWLVGASSGSVLGYYAIAHLSAMRQPSVERILPGGVAWCGLGGCVLLLVTLPWQSVAVTAVIAATAALTWWSGRGRRAILG